MSWSSRTSRARIGAAAILAALLALVPVATHAQSVTLIRGARVFDGQRSLGTRDVLVRDGLIAEVAARIAPPTGATVVDAAGMTLLPGLIDAHTHVWPGSLQGALTFGVTTELDMFSDTVTAKQYRAEQRAGRATGRADMLSAGTLVTTPGGHGTEYGMTIPTLTAPADAQPFVDARIAEGSDYIKIVYDRGSTYGLRWTTFDRATLRALTAAAHARNRLAVVHIGDLASAVDAVEDGADGLVHLFVDRAPTPEFARAVARRGAFVVPTLSVLQSIAAVRGGATLASDARLRPYLGRNELVMLGQTFPARAGSTVSYAHAIETVRALRAAGVPILAGTDAGNPGTAHGASMHGELALLVEAGLTPVEALAAATAAPARAFRLGDRGRIAAGLRADLLLVRGDPTTDITATRDIVGVWKLGVPFDRAAAAAAIAAAATAAANAPRGSESGTVSTFDDGTMVATFGAGWAVSDDKMANGRSEAQLSVVEGGAAGSSHAMRISGQISDAVPYAWAGAMFSPGAQMMTPVNLSGKTEIRFWARGDAGRYRVMVFAESKGFQPQVQSFEVGTEWKEYTMPLSAFGGTDGRDLMALLFVGGPRPGAFTLFVDDVRIR